MGGLGSLLGVGGSAGAMEGLTEEA